MQRFVRKIAVALLAIGVCTSMLAGSAHAQIAFAPCGDSNEEACGHLTVPLDPSGATPGSITLALRRHRAPVGEEKDVVIALAGGPGQAAIPFTEEFTSVLGPIVSTRDLIVFDQRGIGLSHPLSCHRFEQRGGSDSPGHAIAECAGQIGPSRAFYTTAQSVADIEAIRAAGGYEKVVLYGTSYGTKVAELYAQHYPTRVEALVLDSVVPPNGPDPLNRATFAAVPRVLRQLCSRRACAGITPNPTADLTNLVARMGRGGLRGRWIDGHGHGHTIPITSDDLVGMLLAGDLEPTLRAELPAAIRSASHRDVAALARLLVRAASGGEGGEPASPSESFDAPLFYTTSCEEELFPWNRAAGASKRLAEAKGQVDSLPARSVAPFTRANVLSASDMSICAFWPFTTAAPAVDSAPFPSVPTLILSGADDLRTPISNAREVAAAIPGSQLLVVPNTGHSVLGADLTGCSRDALQAAFAGQHVKPCAPTPLPPLLRPGPISPASLRDVSPAHGSGGKRGRTLTAVALTLADLARQLEQAALAQLSSASGANLTSLSSLEVGGLRAGWAGVASGKAFLHSYSYVPGVTISGQLTSERVELGVSGYAAAHGALRLGPHNTLIGVLEGQHVHVPRASASAASTRAGLADVRSASVALRRVAAAGSAPVTEAARLRTLLGG